MAAMSDDPAPNLPAAGPMPPGHPPVRFGRVGVLVVNLGSPSGTDTASVRRYLREFLSDPRVIEVPRPIWWLILNLFVLTTRPPKTAHAYSIVWNKETNEAPLVTITRAQAEKLAAALAPQGVVVDWAMRYGEPAIAVAPGGAQGAGLRPHPDRAALSAICGGDHGDGQRQGVRGAGDHALAAGGAHAAALA